MWNVYVTAITAGLFRGSEVPHPDWFAHETIRRKVETHPKRAPVNDRRRSDILQLLLPTDDGYTKMSRTRGTSRRVCERYVKRIYRDHSVKDRNALRAFLAGGATGVA
jgi:hypothetical protein